MTALVNKYIAILFGILFLIPFSIQAQDGDLEDIEVVIQKNKDIKLPKANRNYQMISDIPPVEIGERTELKFGEHKATLNSLDPSIRINKLKPEALDKYFGNYVRLGFGNYTNTYGEAFIGNKRDDKAFYNIALGHNGFRSGPQGRNSSQYRNYVNVNGGLFMDKYTLSTNIFYDRLDFNYFMNNDDGYFGPNGVLTEDNIFIPEENHYARFGLGLNLQKTAVNDYLNFEIPVSFKSISDGFDQSENNIQLGLNADYDLSLGKKINLRTDALFTTYNYNEKYNAFSPQPRELLADNNTSLSRQKFGISPTFELNESAFRIEGGLNLTYETDTFLEDDVHIYPLLDFQYLGMQEDLIPYAGVRGGIINNTWYDLSAQYQALGLNNALVFSNNKIEFYGGIRTSFLPKTDVDLGFNYSNIDNLPVTILTGYGKLRAIYAKNVNRTTLRLSTKTELSKNSSIGLQLNYNSYSMSDSIEAWHLPALESKLFYLQSIQDKIYINVDIFFINGIFAQATQDNMLELDPIFDLNAKVEYLFSERFSSFVELRNILSNNYQRYLLIESRGFQARAGLTYSF